MVGVLDEVVATLGRPAELIRAEEPIVWVSQSYGLGVWISVVDKLWGEAKVLTCSAFVKRRSRGAKASLTLIRVHHERVHDTCTYLIG